VLITNDKSVNVSLPEYASKLAKDFTIQISPIYDESTNNSTYRVSKVIDNKFTIYGNNGEYFWVVYGKRNDIITEPNKKDTEIKGTGPYKWL
jgi:hypothetical protein